MAKEQFIKHMADKDRVDTPLLVREKQLLKDKKGNDYLNLTLSDITGTLNARMWDNVQESAQQFEAGQITWVKGKVQIFQSRRQIIVQQIKPLDKEHFDWSDFVSGPSRSVDELITELQALIERVENSQVRELLDLTLNDSEIRKALYDCPAAKSIHHAFPGGLVEHIHSIAHLMVKISDHYPQLDFDLLLFGAVYHDIGKVWELTGAPMTEYTDRGRLVGHLVMASELVDQVASKIEGFDPKLKDILKHIVLSHHGKLEYGSPKRPKFLEAYVVSQIDELDSRINQLTTFLQGEADEGVEWTNYSPHFERYFYLKPLRDLQSREDKK